MKLRIEVKSPLMLTNGNAQDSFETFLLFNSGNSGTKLIDIERTLDKCNRIETNKLIKLFDLYFKQKGPGTNPKNSYRNEKNEIKDYFKTLNDTKKLELYADEIYVDQEILRAKNEIKMIYHNKVNTKGGMKIVPYIPGSSIKGAIRNAILFDKLEKDAGLKKSIKDQYPSINPFIYTQFGNLDKDIFEFIEFTDFYPENFDYKLGIVKLERIKVGTQPSSKPSSKPSSMRMAIKSGSFTGIMHLSHLLITRLRFYKEEDKEKLINKFVYYFSSRNNEKELRDVFEKMISLSDLKKVEKLVFEKIISCLNHFTHVNANSDVINDENAGWVYLGFGKGSKLTTVIRAFNLEELGKFEISKKRRKKIRIKNILEPTTNYQNVSQGVTHFPELRYIGLCSLKAVGDDN